MGFEARAVSMANEIRRCHYSCGRHVPNKAQSVCNDFKSVTTTLAVKTGGHVAYAPQF